MFRKILIANRGEIAVRVIRACREMGISPAAAYSDIDKNALHVRLADEAYPVGKASPSESYLNIDNIMSAVKESGAEALHPGYGFLAENPELVRRCEKEGIVFIGPQSESMEIMGRKTASRRKMKEAGVPIVPGTVEAVTDEDNLKKAADEIGYPVLLKASAGGGGKGLRLVKNQKDLAASFRMAQSEAEASFDDSSVYIEKYMEEPHHIEIQILADNFGHTVYLGERECSIQRRYQKVLEETPSPFLDEATRRRMGEIAVRAAEAVNYRNAGTVEFIVDKNRDFYFLEMNTRLQVEHPVTEMVTGIDLVKCQIRVAAGLPLGYAQKDIRPKGSSIQCRIYAEDPAKDFMPSPGRIVHLRPPAGGLGVREDSGVYPGYNVPLEYDPLIAKLITWGETREEAIQRMLRSLSEYQIYGIKTTIPFFQRILRHPDFFRGRYNTHFISSLENEKEQEDEEAEIVALITAGLRSFSEGRCGLRRMGTRTGSQWKMQGRIQNLSSRL
jgi:acetyl-CoA carboxylase biotin carboxylase subunit